MKIAKFGGTSVGTVSDIDRCLQILIDDRSYKIAVVSATAGTSNELTAVLEQCYNGRLSEALVLLDEILMRHIELA
nr:hypothetical protein [Saprospiraceae bacterium]